MKDYSRSDGLFRQRALEEDGRMITAIGAGLVRAMNLDGVSVSPDEEQCRFAQGKIQDEIQPQISTPKHSPTASGTMDPIATKRLGSRPA